VASAGAARPAAMLARLMPRKADRRDVVGMVSALGMVLRPVLWVRPGRGVAPAPSGPLAMPGAAGRG
jgi:hypothetical protein